ncbi:MAG TPA: NAD(P)H-hydrate dehydratase [Gemmatimonadaceae bacterium]|nr:NAD(P)H-hydrate dehydratase [Gemmatimonadaceae bacterium]
MTVRVLSARESAERELAAIGGGVPSRALMQRAGAAAAGEIALRYPDRLTSGVVVFAGSGNNGGDGWVVARALAAVGARVRVAEVGEAKTEDARAERALGLPHVTAGPARGAEGIIVDALLGTGTTGAPRGSVAEAVARIAELRGQGSVVVALDVPSGIEATTGDREGAVRADLTITFAAAKRGHLVAREACGRLVVVDIGLPPAAAERSPQLVDDAWMASALPPIPPDAHKGIRKKVVIVGGAEGMAGAATLAAWAASRSGVGMTRLLVARGSLGSVQTAAPQSLAAAWPQSADEVSRLVNDWADAVLIGPGLGEGVASRELVERVLRGWRGPVVVDADALNVFKDDPDALGALLGGRPALLTPHVAEFARLARCTTSYVLEHRFDIGGGLAQRLRCAVLLKGTPTVVTDPAGDRLVSAAGNATLAAAGSGDVLAGIAATLLAQTGDPLRAGACAAWAHGRAAELATHGRPVRGSTLDDVVSRLADAWPSRAAPRRYPVLAELPPAEGEG